MAVTWKGVVPAAGAGGPVGGRAAGAPPFPGSGPVRPAACAAFKHVTRQQGIARSPGSLGPLRCAQNASSGVFPLSHLYT